MPTTRTDIAVWIAPDVPEGWRDAFTDAARLGLSWSLVNEITDADCSINSEDPEGLVAYYGDWTITLADSGRDSAWLLAGWLTAAEYI